MKSLRSLPIIIAGTLLLHFFASAQRINVGEKCPNIKLTTILNRQSPNAELLTAFNDKPLIIDFWFIGCAPCYEFIPKLDSLQKAYHNQFNILLASKNKEEEIRNFMGKKNLFKNIDAPIVHSAISKTDLFKLFPHYSEPHEVWIDKKGIVQAITSHQWVTPDNIDRFLRGEPLNLPEKQDMLDEERALGGQPLFITDEKYCSGKRKLYYSWIGSADPKVPGLTIHKIQKEEGSRRIVCQNTSIVKLYQIAYSAVPSYGLLKIVMTPKDSLKYATNEKTFKNIFCYEIFLKDTTESKIKKMMQKELDYFFQMKSTIQQEKSSYLVLSRLKGTESVFRAKEDAQPSNSIVNDSIVIKNIKLDYIVQNNFFKKLPYNVINETNYDGKVDITIPNSKDLKDLKQCLNKYGFDINLEIRNTNVVVLQDI
ncbi:TlpA family protein disulfide reductase [Chitinophaga varians]|uniref:TlpA family protein disulfide reductase n=1 Tax=Chitinophaga varians TaxID=2202339 RepID=A0A847RTG5_9BACT|nr:TlpA disulfide reductase family protein [Chitinophaga varians]NLR68900.1 TlpA family protein disulfide reductase [Chitinophaga varians]